jgi:eukaryotic-like serine/threonine-protein kinase
MLASESTSPSEEADAGGGRQGLIGVLLCGKWRVERLLGAGGMSSVYAATHRNGNRVALKILNRPLSASPAARRRFLREGYIANRVRHRGVVPVLDDAETDDGLVFLVMELVEGQTLEALREERGGKLAPSEVARLADELLEILITAHASGVVHRDVKPGNVLLAPDGQVKLLDFGIARLRELTEFGEATASGVALGTPAFMAPEQARGRWDEVDARTDVWAVGATLFRLLSGRTVHEPTTPNELMIASATTPAPRLSSVCSDVPAALEAVVDRALRLDPNERWQSAAEMRAALQAKRRRKLPVWIHVLAVVLGFTLLAALLFARRNPASTRGVPEAAPPAIVAAPPVAAASPSPNPPASLAPSAAAITPTTPPRPRLRPRASAEVKSDPSLDELMNKRR